MDKSEKLHVKGFLESDKNISEEDKIKLHKIMSSSVISFSKLENISPEDRENLEGQVYVLLQSPPSLPTPGGLYLTRDDEQYLEGGAKNVSDED